MEIPNGYDAVHWFLDGYRGRASVGSGFVLPDIGQGYRVVDLIGYANPRETARVTELIVFEANCAVCDEIFTVARSERRMCGRPHFTRTCPAHRGQFRTSESGFWLSPQARAAVAAKRAERRRETRRRGNAKLAERRKAERAAHPHLGSTQRAIVEAIEALGLVSVPTARAVVAAVAARMPRGHSALDERRRTVRRVLRGMIKGGKLDSKLV